jgi:catechol 2,3-dioxygenase-like lactoylglutathione lyase family enzyme
MTVNRISINICADRLPKSRDFHMALLGLEVAFESDWYVQLRSAANPTLEFGLIRRDHELVPPEFQTAPTGMYVTFVVPEVDRVYEKALSMGLRIVQEPKNEFYGHRRFLTVDPNSCLLDMYTPFS